MAGTGDSNGTSGDDIFMRLVAERQSNKPQLGRLMLERLLAMRVIGSVKIRPLKRPDTGVVIGVKRESKTSCFKLRTMTP